MRRIFLSCAASLPLLMVCTCSPDAPTKPSLETRHDSSTDRFGNDTKHNSPAGFQTENGTTVQRLIEDTGSNIFHLDLHTRGGGRNSGGNGSSSSTNEEGLAGVSPWFEGFGVAWVKTEAAAVTVSHPVRRILSYLKEEGVGLEEALSWMDGEGIASNLSTHYGWGYQLVDNYLVRVLAGKSAWDLPPGNITKEELQAARVALGKFEVLLREDCLSIDLPLLGPYLGIQISADDAANMVSDAEGFYETEGLLLPSGALGHRLARANHWDLQLWEFANDLVVSRSTTVDKCLRSSTKLARARMFPGKGRRAVVYNSPAWHLTSVSMFSCMLKSWGFHVTAVVKEPPQGYDQLLHCADQTISLEEPTAPAGNMNSTNSHGIISNSTVEDMLGLPPYTPDTQNRYRGRPANMTRRPISGGGGHLRRGLVALDNETGAADMAESGGGGRGDGSGGDRDKGGDGQGLGEVGAQDGGVTRGGGGRGLFDVSVLCTAFRDLNVLFDPLQNSMDPRLVEVLLWRVKTSIWNMHGVSRGLMDGAIPPGAHDFAARKPSRTGRRPPPTFLTVYGEQVKTWEESLQDGYEGWGQATSAKMRSNKPKAITNLKGLFPQPGVVYPILPTGYMKLPKPSGKVPFNAEASPVKFVIQGTLVSNRRDYKTLLTCLEAMCTGGKDNFSLDAVGAEGDIHEELDAHPCTKSRYTEGKALEYKDFYGRIRVGDFVVTAAAGDDYEYDRATSSVPTAMLLERPLVMSASLLDAYPCLRKSRVHSMVANDDLCLNLQAAYDLTPEEYDEMVLEAQDCKLQMMRQTRETVREIVLTGRALA